MVLRGNAYTLLNTETRRSQSFSKKCVTSFLDPPRILPKTSLCPPCLCVKFVSPRRPPLGALGRRKTLCGSASLRETKAQVHSLPSKIKRPSAGARPAEGLDAIQFIARHQSRGILYVSNSLSTTNSTTVDLAMTPGPGSGFPIDRPPPFQTPATHPGGTPSPAFVAPGLRPF